jgi:hypothetical protein
VNYVLQITAAVITFAMLTLVPTRAQAEMAGADDGVKMRMTNFDDPFFQNSARAGINIMSMCRAKKRPAQALEALSYAYMSDGQTESLNNLSKRFRYDSSCAFTKNVGSDLSSASVVGGLAEFFILQRYKPENVTSLGKMGQSDWTNRTMAPRNGIERFGQCVVKTDSSKILGLIKTVPDTSAERSAIKNLVPSLGPCLAKGQKISFDKNSLRGILAYSLFRNVQQHKKMMEAAE